MTGLGVNDYDELYGGTNPNSAADDGTVASFDTDGDGLTDAEEASVGTDPNLADTDGGGIDDLSELLAGLNPLDPADG